MAIKIFTDSGTDYEQYEIKEKNIDVLPIPIEIDGHEYLSGFNLSKNEFFQMLENGCSFPKTAQPSPQVYIDYFEEAKKNFGLAGFFHRKQWKSAEISDTISC